MLVEWYLKVSVMFLKHSNTCCEQALKEREIRTKLQLSSATALDDLKIKVITFLKIWLNNSTNSITSFTYSITKRIDYFCQTSTEVLIEN